MWKKKERWTAAALLLAMVVVTGLCWYILYIRQQFYDEGTRNLLETYEQVDKSFTIFSRSNWNMLNEWGKSLQAANEEGLAEERLRSYEAEREIWRYSSVYLFNENCEYWSIRGKHEKVDHLWTAFEEMYRTGKPYGVQLHHAERGAPGGILCAHCAGGDRRHHLHQPCRELSE